MLYLVSTLEYTGIGIQRMAVNYGVFSSEQKAKNAINDICKKLAKITIESDNSFSEKDLPKFILEYVQKFDITKLPDIDSVLLFINKIPKW